MPLGRNLNLRNSCPNLPLCPHVVAQVELAVTAVQQLKEENVGNRLLYPDVPLSSHGHVFILLVSAVLAILGPMPRITIDEADTILLLFFYFKEVVWLVSHWLGF